MSIAQRASRLWLSVCLTIGVAFSAAVTASAVAPAAPTMRGVKMTIPSAASKSTFGLNSEVVFFNIEWDDLATDENFYEVQVRIAPSIQTNYGLLLYPQANEQSYLWVINLQQYGIQQGQLVEFRVRACKGVRSSDSSAIISEASAYVSGSVSYDSIAEVGFTAPSSLVAGIAPGSDGLIRMSWTDNSDKEESNEVFVKKTTDSAYPTTAYLTFGNFYFGRNPQDSAFFLKPGSSYNLKVRARRSTAWGVVSGNTVPVAFDYTSFTNEQTVTIPALAAPTVLAVSAVDENTVKLDWNDNSDNETQTSLEYRIPSGSGLYQSLGTVGSNSSDKGTVTFDHIPGLATDWQVRAQHQYDSNDTAVYSNVSNPVTFTLPFNPPTALTVSMAGNPATSQTVATLNWTDSSAVETGYRVYARTTSPANGTYVMIGQVATANATTTTVEPGFLPGTSYDIQVRAYHVTGNIVTESNPSNTVVAVSKDGFSSRSYEPITLGQVFSYQAATTAVSARTSWSITGLPAGLAFNSSNGQVTGTPTEAGLFECPMTATFADGWTTTATLALRVLRPPAAPQKPVDVDARTVPLGSVSIPLSVLFSELDTEAAVRMNTTMGNIDIVLQPTLTPQTYANFMAYANDPDSADNYIGAAFHRVSPGFVVQGGGYKPLTAEGADKFAEVTRKTSPVNEPGISNGAGTVSMAKGSGVNSATHDFFFNLDDNSELDTVANNSFTAFGRVAGSGMTTTVQSIVNLPGQKYTVQLKPSGGTAFESFDPLSSLGSTERWPINAASAPSTMDNTKVVKINSITSLPVLVYNLVSNSDPANVTASIVGSNLVLEGLQDTTTSSIVLTATDVDGNVTTQDFVVTVDGGFNLPTITNNPDNVTVAKGQTATFIVSASGDNLNYQWQKNGRDILGATSATLTISNVTDEDVADYSVRVGNDATFVFSSSAHLTVQLPVEIVTQPVSLTRNYGTSATFSVAVTGDSPITYKWYKGDDEIPSATAATYTINSLLMTSAGSYKVEITNNLNTVTSNVVQLTVNPVDTDNDGLYDHTELASSPATNPTLADTDGDGFVDGLEAGAGTNPTLATSKPDATVFYAQKDAATVLGQMKMKRTPLGTVLNRLDNNNSVTVPELWLAAYELTNQEFASILQKAKDAGLIDVASESGRRVVRYPKVAGEIVCYLASPVSVTAPEATDVDLDSAGSSFTVPVAKALMPASAVSWHGAYLCSVVMNQVHGYTSKNVPATWSYSTADGYYLPNYTDWELAARGGSALPPTFGLAYPTGASVSLALANYNNSATGVAKKVGSYAASKLGLYDLGGNVEEWVFQTDTNTPVNAFTRGGSFADPSTELINTADESLAKTTLSRRVGVRLALKANAAAAFTTQLLARFQRTDQPLTLTAQAAGAPPLTYQWYKNNVAIKGRTDRTLTISSPVLADAGEYHVTVSTNGINPTPSTKVKVALVQASSVVPKTSVAINQSAAFEAMVKGAAGQVFSYQWKLGSTNVQPSTQFINPVSKKLSMILLQPEHSAVYTCAVKLLGQTPDNLLPEVPTSFQLLVYKKPVIPAFNLNEGVVSGSYNFTLPQDSDPTLGITTWTVTGLPAGMSYNPATGLISGKPTASGTFYIKITGKNLAGSSTTIEEELKVYPLEFYTYGTFMGLVDRHAATGINDNLGGRLDVTIASTGKLTGQLQLGATVHRFSGALDNVQPTVSGQTVTYLNPSATILITRKGLPTLKLYFKIKISDRTLIDSYVGELGAGGAAPVTTAVITGWRNFWDKLINPAASYDAKRNVAFTIPVASEGLAGTPQGASYATITVDAAGKTTVSGKLADNVAMTSTGWLSPTGQVPHFQMLYSGKGSLLGKVVTAPATHVVTGTDGLSWLRKDLGAVSKERSYKRGFSTTLTADGGVYQVPTPGTILAGLDPISGMATANAKVVFSQGGLQIVSGMVTVNQFVQNFIMTTTNLVSMPSGATANPQTVAFNPTTSSGLFTGTFVVVNDDPTSLTNPKRQVSRTVTYYGMVIPKTGQAGKGIGYGYFNMPGLPGPGGVTSLNSDILSGKVIFDAVPVVP